MKLFILSYVIKINPIFLGNCITTNRVLKNIVFIFMKYQTAIVTCLISYDTNHSELLSFTLWSMCLLLIHYHSMKTMMKLLIIIMTSNVKHLLSFLKLGRYGVDCCWNSKLSHIN